MKHIQILMSCDLMIVQYLMIIVQYMISRFLIKNTIFGSRGIIFNQPMGSQTMKLKIYKFCHSFFLLDCPRVLCSITFQDA